MAILHYKVFCRVNLVITLRKNLSIQYVCYLTPIFLFLPHSICSQFVFLSTQMNYLDLKLFY